MPPHFVTKLPSLSHKPPPSFLQGAEGGPPSAVGTHITLQLSQCACQELKPWARTEHWEERHTKVERGPCVLTMRPHQNDHGWSGRLAAQARTPVLVRRARAAGPVPPCAFLFWLDLGVAAWLGLGLGLGLRVGFGFGFGFGLGIGVDLGVATLDLVAPCRFAAPGGLRALLSLDLVRRTRQSTAV